MTPHSPPGGALADAARRGATVGSEGLGMSPGALVARLTNQQPKWILTITL